MGLRAGLLCLLFAAGAALLLASAPAPALADRWYAAERRLGAVDAGRRADVARQAGVAWDRVVFLWNRIQPDGPGDWQLERYLEWAGLRESLQSGLPLVAVVQATPSWAAGNVRDGAAAVPTGLGLPVDDPRNTFGQFMARLARAYRGRVGAWILWNEPDFRPGDAGDWWTWAGDAEDLFKIVRAGYRAVKAADPAATVVFPATAYYPDVVNGRELYFARVLQAAARLPDAARNGYYFDAVAVNLYCSLAGIYDIPRAYRAILARHGLDKPLWLTETNCPPTNDPAQAGGAGLGIATHEQAAFLLQAVAMARAANYQRIGWYALVDHDAARIPERWGLVRPDGSLRPAFRAFQVAARYLDHPGPARFLPLDGDPHTHSWRAWRVVSDDPRWQRRVQALWSGPGGPRSVRLPVRGSAARTVDVLGREMRARLEGGWWVVELPPPRAPMPSDPPGFLSLGDPVLLVEEGVSALTPLGPMRVGPPRPAERAFAATGYAIEDDRVWEAYGRLGGAGSLGAPVSYAFPLLGATVQLFEQGAILLPPRGEARLLDLASPDYLPFRAPPGERPALGNLLKALLLGADLPPTLLDEARRSRFFRQYDPDAPDFVARPRELPGTNLAEAF